MTSKRRSKRKSRFKLQTEIDMQPSAMCTNHTDRHSIEQGTLNNHRDAASNQFHVDLQDHIPHVENNSAVPDQNDDMNDKSNEDSDDVLRNTNRKKRGPTFMKEIWGRPSTLPRIEITCDDMGRPIGTKRNKFTDFLGSLARNGKYCPIDVENWHKMPTEKKKDMLNVIKEKYNLPPGTENWTLHSIAKKWRNWKSELKKYYNPELSIQVLLEQRDERAHAEQYMGLITFWNKEKSKEMCEKNKAARKHKIMHQPTGRTSFAQVQHKLEKEKGHPPSRVELFQACFTHALLMPMEVLQAAMNELTNQLPEDSNDPVNQNDIFAQIMGPDRPGRVRMLGDGVSPSDLWGEVPSRGTCNRLVMEQQTKLEKMDEQIKKQGQHIAMLEAKISDQSNQSHFSNCNSNQHTSPNSNPQLLDALF
ncbi:uncharacterized protein LOC122029006 [Zingiber officinale]|uniref:uncharacterized protein LOC122029006 n=1 Tax=Zingiber officinale TaxID=94328 RepID=UPI001C4B350C|nr:uncharacterized protein LOC122029006 [Zingiber officinale]